MPIALHRFVVDRGDSRRDGLYAPPSIHGNHEFS